MKTSKKKICKTIKKNTRKDAPESLAQKYARMSGDEDYLKEIPEITDKELKKNIFPDVRIPVGTSGRGLKIVCDSANDTISFDECEYNGPIPLGFREVPPQLLPIKGIAGKFLKHFAARNFYLGDQINAWFMQNCFIYKACTMPGDDAVSCGYEIVPCGTKKIRSLSRIWASSSTQKTSISMRRCACLSAISAVLADVLLSRALKKMLICPIRLLIIPS